MLPFSRIKHICFDVKDIEATEKFLADLLGVPSTGINTMLLEEGKGLVKVAFFHLASGSIELAYHDLPPSWEGSPLKTAPGFHHIGFETPEFDKALSWLAGKGIHPLPQFPMDTGHSRVAFFRPELTGGILMELHDSAYSEHKSGSKNE
jgi:catechol 2,3-dioxygenase-like lactoylglutathione lyase family enzyme